ncbi:MAG TPA: bifunctional 4-hydroxy-2-oxoglutarate aldolase/2-dehydro-3-deoxy-phosphogluconate aldolase [Spirochaetota bacterium]|nr:bifunctional 4-hydroxy-2-oxoglutarate aldolase/2-dehydro-3-deoxy-phosphogluconate aldolase [Spirochaetota bacterium]
MLSQDERLDAFALLSRHRLIPIATFPDESSALRVAELLAEHSLGVLEITLRSDAALACVAAVRKRFPGLLVGAGSVLDVESLKKAAGAGAGFCMSPCVDRGVMDAARDAGVLFIPGIATPTELCAALNAGARAVKIFPADTLGGPRYVASLVPPFAARDFGLVITGGVTAENFLSYMANPRVIACGTSRLADPELIAAGRYDELSTRMKAFAALCRSLDGRPISSTP